METVMASLTWDGPEADRLALFAEPASGLVTGDPLTDRVVALRTADEDETLRDDLIGIEILGFLDFDHWGDVPVEPRLWQVPGLPPLPLVPLLKRLQAEFRALPEDQPAGP